MRFGVIACPKCRRVQAVELRFGRTTCRNCRKPTETAGLRYFYKGENQEEARAVVMRVSAQLAGMGIEDYGRLLERLESDRERGTTDQVLEAMAARSDFGLEEWAEEMRRLRVPGEASKVLGAMAAENRVYEPRAGRFRVV